MHGENGQVMKRMDKLNVDMTAKCELMQINIAFTQDLNRAKERQRGQLDVRLEELTQ